MGEWINVNDRLPPANHMVCCAIYTTDVYIGEPGETLEQTHKRVSEEAEKHPHCEFCCIDNDGYWIGDMGFPMVCTPRYWCELPEPPKEVK